MSIVRLGCVLVCTFALSGLTVACSSDDSSTNDGSSSGSPGGKTGDPSDKTPGDKDGEPGKQPGGDNEGSACEIPPGTYTAKYTTKPGGTGPAGQPCPDLPEAPVEVKAQQEPTEPTEGCTVDTDESTCTTTLKCEIKQAGMTTTTENVTTTKDGAVTGSTSSKVVKDDDGSVINDCAYDFEWTKS